MLKAVLWRDIRRGLFRTAALGLVVGPFAILDLSRPSRVMADWVLVGSLIPTVALAFVALALLEGRERRGSGGLWQRALAVLAVWAVGSALTPLLFLQAAYVDAALNVDTGAGMSEVQRVLSNWLGRPAEMFLGCLVIGLPAVLLSLPRMRGDNYPTAGAIKIALLCSLPLLLLSPCSFPVPAVFIGGASLLYTFGDGVEGRLFRDRREAGASALMARLRAREIRHVDLRLAAELGDPAALKARGESPPEQTSPQDMINAVLLFEGGVVARAVVLLAQATIPSHPEPATVRAALSVVARQILSPSEAHESAVAALRTKWVWQAAPTPPAVRAVHDAIEACLALDEPHGVLTWARSARSVVGEALEVSTPDAIVETLREELVAWCLEKRDPLDLIAAEALVEPEAVEPEPEASSAKEEQPSRPSQLGRLPPRPTDEDDLIVPVSPDND